MTHFDTDECDLSFQPSVCSELDEIVIHLAGHEDDSFDFRRVGESFGKNRLERGSLAHVGETRGRGGEAKVSFRRENDQRFAVGPEHLSSEQVEVLRGRRDVDGVERRREWLST